ncbi:hypothetical protein VTL71DRAFT_13288 [Oculimacula yallundae]|uniref:Uncharacterized protein n=1 Tax=Oculimacula yallundae TaxID=86028 RepID=A0ABR4CL70_9HELO
MSTFSGSISIPKINIIKPRSSE